MARSKKPAPVPSATDLPDSKALAGGLRIERTFTEGEGDPFSTVEWETREAAIRNPKGEAVFEQKGVEFPASWSQLATNVVASKYFYGDLSHGNGDPGEGRREYSLRQLVHRVTRTIADWGTEQGYFASEADGERFYDELTWLCLHQHGAFNSPVWFNVGLHHQYGVRDTGGKKIFSWDAEQQEVVPVDPYERPQASACFIISVDDSIDDIWKLMAESARLFKFGSGVGADWSTLRSSREKLSGGGIPSGPVSFMRVQDATGGTIKSGGKTRRAAIMQTLKCWHPDVMEFVEAKMEEEKKAWALIEEGYDGSFNGPAYGSVAFQNVNQSLRVTDAFMEASEKRQPYGLRAVTSGEVVQEIAAYDVLHTVAEGTHLCGDPGLQYEDTIQRWHTCKHSGPINSSNPCVTGDTLVATEDGLRRIDALVGETPRVVGLDGRLHRTSRVIETGTKPVYRMRTRAGYEVKLTADHRVWTENRGDVAAQDLTRDDVVRLVPGRFGSEALDVDLAEYAGLMLGAGHLEDGQATLDLGGRGALLVAEKAAGILSRFEEDEPVAVATNEAGRPAVATGTAAVQALLERCAVLGPAAERRLTERALRLNGDAIAGLVRGLFTAAGTVVEAGARTPYVGLTHASEALLQQVQVLLLGFGVKSRIVRDRRLLAGDAPQVHSLRIGRRSRVQFERAVGFLTESPKADALAELNASVAPSSDPLVDTVVALDPMGEAPVYDLTEPITDHFAAGGVAVHNCSEYMFLDNSACNLASLNLRKFQRADGTVDVERFRAAARIYITAMEILVDNAGYPSEQIARNSHAYRPLGLGFANLGALLMAMGLPYDSDQGRAVAGALMAIEHCEAYARSAEIAANKKIGPFEGYAANREPFLDVMRMHQAATEEIHPSCPEDLQQAARESAARMVALGERHGYRNAQATVLAPTGTIAFMMDCDTTGIEPDIALVKYKLLAGKGDGMLKIVNRTVREALGRLGYSDAEQEAILAYVDEHDTIEGAPGLKDEHLPVFDCAFKPFKGTRSIHHAGHIKMMAACQPFISGAISKTVNMPEASSADEIQEAYMLGWRLGLKAVAIYRENSKRSQPLSTSEGGNTKNKEQKAEVASGDGALVEEPGRDVNARVIEREVVKEIETIVYQPVRKRLPDERPSVTHKFAIAGHEGYLHIGLYPETRLPGEIFITMAKEGSTISGMMDAFATAISLSLQYGVPLEDLVTKFSHMRFEPSGFTNNKQIPIAKSLMDYIFRYLSLKFLQKPVEEPTTVNPKAAVAEVIDRSGPALDEVQMDMFSEPTADVDPLIGATVEGFLTEAEGEVKPGTARMEVPASSATFQNQDDSPPCPNCGAITVRSGACYVCTQCGTSSGCG